MVEGVDDFAVPRFRGEAAMVSDEEYGLIQAQLNVATAMIKPLKLREFLNRIERAESVGPVLDPTLYREAMDKMASVKRIAAAALELQRIANEEEERHDPKKDVSCS
jgi:hypothetical protein